MNRLQLVFFQCAKSTESMKSINNGNAASHWCQKIISSRLRLLIATDPEINLESIWVSIKSGWKMRSAKGGQGILIAWTLRNLFSGSSIPGVGTVSKKGKRTSRHTPDWNLHFILLTHDPERRINEYV